MILNVMNCLDKIQLIPAIKKMIQNVENYELRRPQIKKQLPNQYYHILLIFLENFKAPFLLWSQKNDCTKSLSSLPVS